MKKKQPKDKPIEWVCHACGLQCGYHHCGITTWHLGICGVCGETTSVTEPRDFGYLKYQGEWSEST